VLLDGQELGPDQRSEFRFRTAGEGPFTFLAYGDSGLGTPEQKQVAERMARETAPVPAFVLHVGDIPYVSGTFDEFQRRHFPFYRTMMRRVPFFTAPGNHEYVTNSAAPYLSLHAPPVDDVPIADRGRYYSFDWGNVHFVSLDSNRPLVDAAKGT